MPSPPPPAPRLRSGNGPGRRSDLVLAAVAVGHGRSGSKRFPESIHATSKTVASGRGDQRVPMFLDESGDDPVVSRWLRLGREHPSHLSTDARRLRSGCESNQFLLRICEGFRCTRKFAARCLQVVGDSRISQDPSVGFANGETDFDPLFPARFQSSAGIHRAIPIGVTEHQEALTTFRKRTDGLCEEGSATSFGKGARLEMGHDHDGDAFQDPKTKHVFAEEEERPVQSFRNNCDGETARARE